MSYPIEVDFNGPNERGLYSVLLEDAPGVSVGDELSVCDDEGDTYDARVIAIDVRLGLVLLAVECGTVVSESPSRVSVTV